MCVRPWDRDDDSTLQREHACLAHREGLYPDEASCQASCYLQNPNNKKQFPDKPIQSAEPKLTKDALVAAFQEALDAFNEEWEDKKVRIEAPVRSLQLRIRQVEDSFEGRRRELEIKYSQPMDLYKPRQGGLERAKDAARLKAEDINRGRDIARRGPGGGYPPLNVDAYVAKAAAEFEREEARRARKLQEVTEAYNGELAAIDADVKEATKGMRSDLRKATREMTTFREKRRKAELALRETHAEAYAAWANPFVSDSDDDD